MISMNTLEGARGKGQTNVYRAPGWALVALIAAMASMPLGAQSSLLSGYSPSGNPNGGLQF